MLNPPARTWCIRSRNGHLAAITMLADKRRFIACFCSHDAADAVWSSEKKINPAFAAAEGVIEYAPVAEALVQAKERGCLGVGLFASGPQGTERFAEVLVR